MKRSGFKVVLTIFILIFTKSLSAQDDGCFKKYKPRRYFYDFTKKKLQESQTPTTEIVPPLKFRSGRDLRIEFFNFNPLKMQISVSDSSSNWFLADTASFSKYIILPKVPDLPQGNKTEAKLVEADHSLKKSDFAADIFKVETLIEAAPGSTDCDKITALMSSLNNQKQKIFDAILNYKGFCESAEVINDSYSRLQTLYSLNVVAVNSEITQFFLPQFNAFLSSQGESALSSDANLVSARQIEEKEQIFYQKILAETAKLSKIKIKSDQLTGADCGAAKFTPLLKSFTSNLQVIQDSVQGFKNTYILLVHPAFMKTMDVYATIKLYMMQDPVFVTNALTITGDYDVISVYKKGAAEQNKVLYDEIHVTPVRGWKLDIAGGFFFTGLADNLYTRNTKDSIYMTKYLVDGVPRDTTELHTFTSITQQKQASIGFGGMVYLHAHTQNAGTVNYGVSIGFGALFNDQTRWAGSFGPTILIGQRQRFNINPCIMLAQVDKLSAPYQTAVWYSQTIDNVPTYRAWAVSWGVGLSWNLK
jgi:hypothetical protein